MTRDPDLDLALHRLSRAREALRDGDLLLKGGSLTGAMSRLYYAAFYTARAVLATRGMDAKRHSGVIALFQQHFVKTGLVQADVAKVLPRSFERRQDSDYADFTVLELAEVSSLRADVSDFVDACARFVERAR